MANSPASTASVSSSSAPSGGIASIPVGGHTHPLTLHPLIDPVSIRAVLNVGAGTCAAIVDVARLVHWMRGATGNNRSMSMPGADPERSADGTNGDTLDSSGEVLRSNGEPAHQATNGQRPPPALFFACDITPAKFPPQETLQKLGIRAFEHDIRAELPGGMAGELFASEG
ncbi:hypothetical protein EV715DRAFT_297218 [Schizophyllum commune]